MVIREKPNRIEHDLGVVSSSRDSIRSRSCRYLQEQTCQMDSGSLLLGFLDFYGNHFDPRTTGISVGRSRYFSRSAPLSPPPGPPPVTRLPGAPGAARMYYGQVGCLFLAPQSEIARSRSTLMLTNMMITTATRHSVCYCPNTMKLSYARQ